MTDEKQPADEVETVTAETPAEVADTAGGGAPPDDTATDPADPVPADDQADPVDPEDPPDIAASGSGDDPAEAEKQPEFKSPKTGKPLSGAALAAAKKKADAARRETAIAEAADNMPEPSDEVTAEDERRDAIADKLLEIDEEVQEIDARAAKLRKKQQKLMLQLYPQQGENDPHSVAVRGYLNASHRERQHRALAPARMKVMLKAAGMAPIDAAMQRKSARGFARPKRSLNKQGLPPGQDQAPGGIPDKTAEKTE